MVSENGQSGVVCSAKLDGSSRGVFATAGSKV